jgi:hypothetical protein
MALSSPATEESVCQVFSTDSKDSRERLLSMKSAVADARSADFPFGGGLACNIDPQNSVADFIQALNRFCVSVNALPSSVM